MAQHLIESRLIDGVPTQRLLSSLAHLYPWIVVMDADRRILWISDEASVLFGGEGVALGRDAREFLSLLPNPDQVFLLRSHLRNRAHLEAVVLVAQVHGAVVRDPRDVRAVEALDDALSDPQ